VRNGKRLSEQRGLRYKAVDVRGGAIVDYLPERFVLLYNENDVIWARES